MQTMRAELPCCVENVCIETDPESSHLYAVGSRSHVMLIDGREDGKRMHVDSIKSLDKDCGKVLSIWKKNKQTLWVCYVPAGLYVEIGEGSYSPWLPLSLMLQLYFPPGVRSLQFNSHLLSIGTGAGHLYFYDIRARKYLNHDADCRCTSSQGKSQACSLTASPGWLVSGIFGACSYLATFIVKKKKKNTCAAIQLG